MYARGGFFSFPEAFYSIPVYQIIKCLRTQKKKKTKKEYFSLVIFIVLKANNWLFRETETLDSHLSNSISCNASKSLLLCTKHKEEVKSSSIAQETGLIFKQGQTSVR